MQSFLFYFLIIIIIKLIKIISIIFHKFFQTNFKFSSTLLKICIKKKKDLKEKKDLSLFIKMQKTLIKSY